MTAEKENTIAKGKIGDGGLKAGLCCDCALRELAVDEHKRAFGDFLVDNLGEERILEKVHAEPHRVLLALLRRHRLPIGRRTVDSEVEADHLGAVLKVAQFRFVANAAQQSGAREVALGHAWHSGACKHKTSRREHAQQKSNAKYRTKLEYVLKKRKKKKKIVTLCCLKISLFFFFFLLDYSLTLCDDSRFS